MLLEDRPPDTSTTFVDSISGEVVLQIASDENGVLMLAYRLYDESGELVAESVLKRPDFGLAVHAQCGDLLLSVPADLGGSLQYRLHASNGTLLTYSDGARTKIYPHLRMESVGRARPLPR
jgi:hypothetical protein